MGNSNKPEILAPAGSTESVYAAVRCGADGVYVGGKAFSARANAVNFSAEELKTAADYCHLHGVKIYRAMNVVIFDSECNEFYNEVQYSARIGIDGLIIQDIGAAAIARAAVADMPLHSSTQMTIHTPLGAMAAQNMGFCRVVPARELTLEDIEKICRTGVETEVFVHGAQCMCVSGQCYMSAVIGSRSANRGQCAQACRLPFSCGKKPSESYALSLKDMSLAAHIDELIRAGAASFKIEGRMKRPEYTAAAVTAMHHAADGTGDLSADMKRLEAVFSRSGFTDGYLTGNTGADMFGHRRKEDVISANSVLPELAALYKDERRIGAMDFEFAAKRDIPSRLKFSCGGVSGEITGKMPEEARNRSITPEDISKQLSKLGDTVYTPGRISCDLDEGIMLPASEINRMRREASALADEMIIAKNTPVYSISTAPLQGIEPAEKYSGEIKLRLRSDSIKNIASSADSAEMLILPLSECKKLTDSRLIGKTAVSLPLFVTDEEKLQKRLISLREKGFQHYICENFTHIGVLNTLGDIHIHGGSGMNITNSYAVSQCRKLNFEDCTVSFEMKSAQVSSLRAEIPIGIYAYGRLPLMTVRNCPVKAEVGCGKCTHSLTDRTGRVFPVKCAEGYAQILNCDVLETSDRLDSFKGIAFAVIDAGGLDPSQTEKLLDRYKSRRPPEGKFTRGLYGRGVL